MQLLKEQLHAPCHTDSLYYRPVDPNSTTPFVVSDFQPGAAQVADVCHPVLRIAVSLQIIIFARI